MASPRIQESFLLGKFQKNTQSVFKWWCTACFGGKIQTEKAADQLSELLFLARKN